MYASTMTALQGANINGILVVNLSLVQHVQFYNERFACHGTSVLYICQTHILICYPHL